MCVCADSVSRGPRVKEKSRKRELGSMVSSCYHVFCRDRPTQRNSGSYNVFVLIRVDFRTRRTLELHRSEGFGAGASN